MAIDLKQGIQSLQQAYLKRLASQVGEFRRLHEVMAKGLLPMGDIQFLYRQTHNLTGSGTTFGFPEISRTARELHASLRHFMSLDSGMHETAGARADLLEKLRVFEETCRETVSRKSAAAKLESTIIAFPAPVREDIPVLGLLAAASGEGLQELVRQLTHFGYRIQPFETVSALLQHAGALEAVLVHGVLEESEAEILRAARTDYQASGYPLIFIGGQEEFEERLRAVRAGALGYFTEKADPVHIIDRIEQVAARTQAQPWRVLVVDEDDMLAEFYTHALKSAGMLTTRLSQPKQALEALQAQPVDLLLVTYSMPQCNGRELAALVLQYERFAHLPVLFMAPRDEMGALLTDTGLSAGDFLAKPFTPEQLVEAVTQQVRRAAELRVLSARDAFTGLLSRAHFLEALALEAVNVRRHGQPSTYALVDVDYLKQLNDQHGFAAGDQVIKSLALLLKKRLRRSDVTGRCGGEEFGILLPGCTLGQAEAVLEELRAAFAGFAYKAGKDAFTATFSAGIIAVSGESSVDEMVAQAGAVLQQAKRTGHNRVAVQGKN